jgi:hypothetical protein
MALRDFRLKRPDLLSFKAIMRPDVNKLFLEPGPCKGCSFEIDCKNEEMACRAFASYVLRGTFFKDAPRIPTCSIYNKIFSESDELALKYFLQQFKADEDDEKV